MLAWESRAQAKIALKVDGEEVMDNIEREARARGLVTYIVTDAGRTQIPAGSRTVLAIGPAPVQDIDAITGPRGLFPLSLMN